MPHKVVVALAPVVVRLRSSLIACGLCWLTAVVDCQAASGLDVDCQVASGLWRRAADPSLAEYCRLIFFARARRSTDPGAAVLLSKQALSLRPGGLLARVELGQALLLSGSAAAAYAEFSHLLADSAQSVFRRLTPQELASAGRAALLSSQYSEAARFYRAAALLLGSESPSEEARTLIEAAAAVTFAEPSAGPEARAYLTNARVKNAPLLYPLIDALVVLSFERDGRPEQAKQRASVFENTWKLSWIFERVEGAQSKSGQPLPALPEGETKRALAAVARFVEPEAVAEWELMDGDEDDLPSHLKERKAER